MGAGTAEEGGLERKSRRPCVDVTAKGAVFKAHALNGGVAAAAPPEIYTDKPAELLYIFLILPKMKNRKWRALVVFDLIEIEVVQVGAMLPI